MGIIFSDKQTNVTRIDCNGTFQVTVSLEAEPNITTNPTDIVLVLDRSGSMSGVPMEHLKMGANTFIDVIAASTGGQDGQLGGGSRMGIVSFAGTAVQNLPMNTSVNDLKEQVNSLQAGGGTNHEDAFSKAIQLFDPSSEHAKVLVMFTDGKTTEGGDPVPAAERAKAQGIEIYAIGLIGDDGIDIGMLKKWASDPSDQHVAVTPDETELQELFEEVAKNISKPGATNLVIEETVNPEFAIISVNPPLKGTVMTLSSRSVRWQIEELGGLERERAVLEFLVRFNGQQSGMYFVNESIAYYDSEGNEVEFPNPQIYVDCGLVVQPETCPEPIDLEVEGCSDQLTVNLGDTYLEGLGRIVQLDVTLKNVCPGKRVALAVVLTELDVQGVEQQRGMKVITVPAHQGTSCQDVLIQCIRFVLPEDLDETGTPAGSMCRNRNLRARVLANYIDSGFVCCDDNTTS